MATAVPTAVLPEISYLKLLRSDPNELISLRKAGERHGFFYLNLVGSENEAVLQRWRHVLAFMEEYFDQAMEVKMQDSRSSDTHGYVQP